MKNLGLVLSGGGARAAAHIGALQALNEHGIYPTHISGASAGALIGALYCNGYSPKKILELTKSHEFLKAFKIGLINKDLMEMLRFKEFLQHHVKSDFKDLQLPLFLSVTNLNTGESEIASEGNLIDYVSASCAFPMLFKPVKIGGNSYIDGGMLNNFPVEPLLKRCDKVIGVSLSTHHFMPKIKNSLIVAERCFHLAIWNTMKDRMPQCDILIHVENLEDYGIFSIKKSDELFKLGYSAALAKINSIKELQ